MKEFIINRLTILARAIIKKYNPIVIGITGSVGKTSARDAIYAVVSAKFKARKPDKNYNNEIGLPLTIIGSDSPYRNPFAWLMLFVKGYSLLWLPREYPKVLVLEMGVDHPGDMDHLLSIVRPHISVLTNIGLAHYEFFKSADAVAAEKRKIIECLNEDDFAILNADNETVMAQKERTKATLVTYGQSDAADYKAAVISEHLEAPARSKLQFSRKTQLTVDIPGVGTPHISACAAAVAVGKTLGIEPELIQRGLREYRPSPGRLNLINGIRGITIVDDSYNASPDSVKEALAVLGRMPNEKKVAVLGDMLELGDKTEEAHFEIGRMVAELRLDLLVTVGFSGRMIAQGAMQFNMPEDLVHSFTTSDDALEYIMQNLIPDSAVLVKGSQGVRMEKISKEILAEPMSAHQVLPRQYDKWIK